MVFEFIYNNFIFYTAPVFNRVRIVNTNKKICALFSFFYATLMKEKSYVLINCENSSFINSIRKEREGVDCFK